MWWGRVEKMFSNITHRAVMRIGLAVVLSVAFLGVLYFVLDKRVEPTEVVMLVIGALIAKFGDVVAYYFNSSAGSEMKTDLLGKKD